VIASTTSIGVYLLEIGWPGKLSIAVFIAGLYYASIIHRRRLGIRHRLALAVYSPLPFLLGLFGISCGFIQVVKAVRDGSVFDPWFGVLAFLEFFQVVPLTLLETIFLLFLSFLLLLHDAVKEQATRRDPS
jgi:hypothetical protein